MSFGSALDSLTMGSHLSPYKDEEQRSGYCILRSASAKQIEGGLTMNKKPSSNFKSLEITVNLSTALLVSIDN